MSPAETRQPLYSNTDKGCIDAAAIMCVGTFFFQLLASLCSREYTTLKTRLALVLKRGGHSGEADLQGGGGGFLRCFHIPVWVCVLSLQRVLLLHAAPITGSRILAARHQS